MEGQLIQISGQVHSLYPSDGGHIQVETIHFVQGSTLIKVCVMKDKHHFYTHITQPNRHQEESPKDAAPMETPSPTNKSVRLGSFSAVLDNGIHLSYSHYGPTGEQGEHLTLMLSVSLSVNHLVWFLFLLWGPTMVPMLCVVMSSFKVTTVTVWLLTCL
uniref:Uncharacterized protein n=1 Tax=Hucho hucho TaxID=62062 RepID=A0A4W5KX28_9TELE